jgi:hypothetical protein
LLPPSPRYEIREAFPYEHRDSDHHKRFEYSARTHCIQIEAALHDMKDHTYANCHGDDVIALAAGLVIQQQQQHVNNSLAAESIISGMKLAEPSIRVARGSTSSRAFSGLFVRKSEVSATGVPLISSITRSGRPDYPLDDLVQLSLTC